MGPGETRNVEFRWGFATFEVEVAIHRGKDVGEKREASACLKERELRSSVAHVSGCYLVNSQRRMS
jgi:hypothetical protein